MSLVVGLIEDSQSVIDGMSIIFKSNPNIKAAYFAKSKAEVFHMIRAYQLDVILLDLGLPDVDGQALIPDIRAQQPNVKIVVFTNFLSSRHVIECMRIGVDGYLLKHEAENHIIEKIMAAANGCPPLSYGINRILLDKLRSSLEDKKCDDDNRSAKLKAYEFGMTEKEIMVLNYIAQGLSIAAVALRINRSSHTVHLHLRSIYKKLNVHSRSAAVHVALSEGIIQKP